jgi:hypothetical protein
MRQNRVNDKGKPSSTIAETVGSSRQDTTEPGSVRPPRATQCATRDCVVAEPDLAAVVNAWPDLPEAIKAGILAKVKTAARAK